MIVPDGMDVDVADPGRRPATARSSTSSRDGFDITLDGSLDGGDDVPDMSINIDLVAGEIIVREAA